MRRYIHAAQREADFLQGSGLWDTTFGGGFWWNTGRGDSEEGKPAQTNALASLFFARLYEATGDAGYRDWALRSLLWLDTILYEPSRNLYRWSVAFQNIPSRAAMFLGRTIVALVTEESARRSARRTGDRAPRRSGNRLCHRESADEHGPGEGRRGR